MTSGLRRAWPLLAHAFLIQMSAYIIRPTSAYHAMELGLSPGFVGLVAASFALVPLVVALPMGQWTDRGREFESLVIGAVAMIVAGFGLLFLASNLWWLLFWNALIGFGHLLSIIGEQSLVAREGKKSMDSAFGTYSFIGSLGQATAPLLLSVVGGSAVIPDTGILITLYTVACVAMLAVSFPMRSWREGPVRPKGEGVSLRGVFSVPADTKRTMVGAMLLSTLVLAAIDLIQVYLPALGVERGIEAWVIGVLLMARAGATMLSRLGMAKLTARFGRRRLVVVASVIAGAAVAALALPVHPVVMGAALVMAGLTLGIGQPLSMSIVSLAAPPGTTSTWLAIRLMGNRLGQSLVPAVVTLFSAATGVAGIFVVTGVGLLATAGIAQGTIRDDL